MRLAKNTASLGLAAVILALPFIGWWKAQAIVDWWKLRDYHAPISISDLANEDTMTPQAIHDFYVNHPQLVSGVSAFRQNCAEAEQTIVLGCYHPVQNGIFVYQVTDTRLTGVEQVTAAHEMLHAAYDRLSNSDKKYVNGLLQSYYNTGLTDQRIKDEINSYKQTEPNAVVNEMHSIIGTEAPNLPTPLENYYKRYFTNRSAVVGFSANYQGEFTTREAEINADKAQLSDLKSKINQEETTLQNQLNQINTDRMTLQNYQNNGQTRQYNQMVPSFNAEVSAYNAGVNQLQADIASYNELVNNYNSIATDLDSLDAAIDTRLTTQTAQ